MFKRNECKKCRRKISEKYEFCPYCGNSLNENLKNEDWGILGKNDFLGNEEQLSNSLFGGIGGGILNKILGNTMKMLEKEMQKEFKNQNMPSRTNFELIINGKRINPKNIKITRYPPKQKVKQIIQPKKNFPTFSEENSKKFSRIKKQEPKTIMRRLSNKVIYEIEIPGVKSINEISIVNLENSIEIKAFTKDKAYSKLIPINLPIIGYNLSEGKLVLELEIKN